MNKISILKWLVGLLVLLNIAILAFMFFGNKPHPPHKGKMSKGDKFIQKRFNFNDEQMKVFKASKQKHTNSTTAVAKSLVDASKAYYLLDVNKTTEKDSMLNEMLLMSKDIFLANDQHFQEMRDNCNPDQLHELDNFINSLLGPDRPSKKRKGPH